MRCTTEYILQQLKHINPYIYIYICLHFNRILIECFLVGDYNVYAYSESEHLISEYGDEHDTEEDY